MTDFKDDDRVFISKFGTNDKLTGYVVGRSISDPTIYLVYINELHECEGKIRKVDKLLMSLIKEECDDYFKVGDGPGLPTGKKGEGIGFNPDGNILWTSSNTLEKRISELEKQVKSLAIRESRMNERIKYFWKELTDADHVLLHRIKELEEKLQLDTECHVVGANNMDRRIEELEEKINVNTNK